MRATGAAQTADARATSPPVAAAEAASEASTGVRKWRQVRSCRRASPLGMMRVVGLLFLVVLLAVCIGDASGAFMEAERAEHGPISASVGRATQHANAQSPVSRMCAFFEQQVAQEYIARMNAYDTLESHEQYVSSALDRILSGVSRDMGVEIVKRSQFARQAPSDFVVLKLYSCNSGSTKKHLGYNADGRMETMCHVAENLLQDPEHVVDTDPDNKIKYFQVNKVYRELELLQLDPKVKKDRTLAGANSQDKRKLSRKVKSKPLTEELGIKAMWDKGYTGKGVKIGVFDTGLSNPRFQNVKERINWTNEKKNEDLVGHGTFVAGVISGTDARCPGIAPDAELYVFRMFTTDQLSFTSWFLDAFNYALFQGIHTLNLSTGGPDFRDRPFVEKIQELAANGVIIVSAVGNSGPKYGTLTNPADQMEVIGVGGVTRDGDVAEFSSRGMTTWELPFGSGRVKPDIVTLSEDIPGFEVSRGCTLLSGTSVSAPIVTGSIALLASMVPAEYRWSLLNPASIKQILIKSADRLEARYDPNEFVIRNHIFEQGNGQLNVTKASELVLDLWRNHQQAAAAVANNNKPEAKAVTRSFTPSSYPESIDTTDCPYMWPLCSQPLYHSSLPLMVNLTILNPVSISGVLDGAPKWIAEESGDNLAVSVASPEVLWPYFGSVGVFVEVKSQAAGFSGVAKGSLSLSIRNGKQIDEVLVPIKVEIIPTPPASKRILWDQFHNIPYPSAFVPRDKLENHHELLDSAGDHPHTNFHQLWNFLLNEGYYIEILPFEYSCMDLQQYGVVLLVDPEEEYFHDEIVALQQAIKYSNVSLLVFADWYDDEVLDTMDMFDTSTLSNWHAITGGANIPALNNLLRDFNIEFGAGAFSSSKVSLLSNDSSVPFPYWSGSYITKFPVGGYLGRVDGVDQSAMTLNQSDVKLNDVPVLGLYQVPSKNGGRIAVFGDSSCIDASVHPSSTGFRNCFDMVRSLLRFTNDGILPDTTHSSTRVSTTTTAATDTHLESGVITKKPQQQQLERLDVEYTGQKSSRAMKRQLTTAASPGEEDTALELRTPPPPRQGRSELKKHSKVLIASEAKPQRQSFCHFYHKQECNMATRVTIQVVESANATRH